MHVIIIKKIVLERLYVCNKDENRVVEINSKRSTYTKHGITKPEDKTAIDLLNIKTKQSPKKEGN